MDNLMVFVSDWWGLIAVGLFFVAWGFWNFEQAKDYVTRLIFMAEEKARKKALETGQERFEWVVDHGLMYMPAKLKLALAFLATVLGTTKQELFRKFVQYVFDTAMNWIKARELE